MRPIMDKTEQGTQAASKKSAAHVGAQRRADRLVPSQCSHTAPMPRNPGTAAEAGMVRERPGQSQRGRAPRRDPGGAPHGEEGIPGGLAGEGGAVHRPHDARGRRHAGPRASPAPRRAGRSARTSSPRSASPTRRRRSARSASIRPWSAPAVKALAGLGHSGRLRRDRLSGRPDAAAAAPRRDPLCGRRRARGEIDIVINRAQVLTQDWKALYDEVKAMREACGEAHLKAILGHRRPQDAAQCLQGQHGGDDGRRRLHQDLDRQGRRQRHPARQPRPCCGRCATMAS